MTSEQGTKADTGKIPLSLHDRYALEEIGRVLAFGAEKYAPDNWRGGIKLRRLLDAALRHLTAVADGEDLDPESGLLHLAHAGCCIEFALWMQKHRPDMDDRWKGQPVRPSGWGVVAPAGSIEASIEAIYGTDKDPPDTLVRL